MSAGGRLAALILGLVILLGAAPARAQKVPADLEARIHLKTLGYDRNLKARSGDRLRIAVVYAAGDPQSEKSRNQIVAAFVAEGKQGTVQGLTPSVVAVAFNSADPARSLREAGATVVYVAAGLESRMPQLQAAASFLRVPLLSGERALVERGGAVAVVADGGRPKIVVNLKISRAVGMDLDPNLLRLAEVLK